MTAQGQDIEIVGIVGAGAMGRGIAQVAATGGMQVLLYDAAAGAAGRARDAINAQLDQLVGKGRMAAADAEAAKGRLKLADSLEALAPADLVVEAIVENLAVKQEVFRQLEAIVRSDCLLASNTSSLRIASIASACQERGRIAGLHFFNPVPLMKLVEVIRAPGTSEATIAALTRVGERMGRVPVVVQDSPGFLVNFGGRVYTQEALRIVSEGVASPAQVDAVMRDAWSFRMGPFELMDLTGIDVNFPVSQIIHEGYFYDRRLATTPLHQLLKESGQFGRKTRRGFFEYDASGKAIVESPDAATDAPAVSRIALAEQDDALGELLRGFGFEVSAFDDGESPLLCAPLGEDCSSFAARLGLDHRRLIGFDIAGKLDKRVTIMRPPGARQDLFDGVIAGLQKAGRAVTAICDSPGFIGQRIAAMVANLGCEMAQIRIARPHDIDKAMTLGLNYPFGPLALADAMGVETVHTIMTQLQTITGDDRYRPSLWLRRRALLGLSALTED
ncbi:MAG TPA: 3-hydroxyacyl-CoA dehydrogenase [Ferrovibrio sp.]|uniref:3-hydroxyacyl-CoA dehydrogenase n=1 Tax=Ferrovibrio sp. TaxID=1917215 RepID=UPI002B4B5BF7|nr:3-hydroxyacyl-CoA dehydrogenase [Ferrovibrio sp.]HLT76507.1 3-hydroxyacyl-CoA dehydrogenase [Ferrovibrio sp.]